MFRSPQNTNVLGSRSRSRPCQVKRSILVSIEVIAAVVDHVRRALRKPYLGRLDSHGRRKRRWTDDRRHRRATWHPRVCG